MLLTIQNIHKHVHTHMERRNDKRLNILVIPPSLTIQFIMTFSVMLITFYSILCGSKMISIQWHSRHSFIVVHQASCETKGRKLATSVFGPLLPVRCSPICPLVAPDVAAPWTDFQMNEISSLGRSTATYVHSDKALQYTATSSVALSIKFFEDEVWTCQSNKHHILLLF